MKFRVAMKTPDALSTAIEEVEDQLTWGGKTLDDVREMCEQWFQYGEVLIVEIDTEARTCTVVPVQ